MEGFVKGKEDVFSRLEFEKVVKKVTSFLLLSYIKFQTKYFYSLLGLTRIFSEMLFERISLIDLLSCEYYNISKIREPDLQKSLFYADRSVYV